LATLIGLAAGLARLSQNFMVRNVTLAISELIRNVPLLLQLIVWYALVINAFPAARDATPVLGVLATNRGLFVPSLVNIGGGNLIWLIPTLWIFCVVAYAIAMRSRRFADRTPRIVLRAVFIGLSVSFVVVWFNSVKLSRPVLEGFNIEGGLSISPEMTALVLGLAVYSGAFIGEVIRSGILSVPRGQKEAAYAIGLRPFQRMRRVILPQALRLILPPLSNVYLSLAKSTSLGVAIGFPDLSSVIGTTINQSGQAVEGVLIQIAAYLTISLIVWCAVDIYDRRTKYVLR
jgi:general L-amino acid transport system permease protein